MNNKFLIFVALFLSIIPSLLFSQIHPQNLESDSPNRLRFGAFSRGTISPIPTYNAYGYDIEDISNPYYLCEPMSTVGTWGLVSENHTLLILSGAWTGREWIVYTMIKPKTPPITEEPGFYLSIEPVSGKIKKIGTGTANKDIKPVSMTYDPVGNKIYGLFETKIYRMSLTDTTIQLIDTIQENGHTIPYGMNAIACNSKGVLYGISVENNLYKIDKSTAHAFRIGNTGVKVNTQRESAQSACFDYRTDDLYWASYNPQELYKIDTITGVATSFAKPFGKSTALFVHYYKQDCPPGDVSDLVFEEDLNNPLKVKITTTSPTLNFNGESQQGLAKAYLYRAKVEPSIEWIIIDSVPVTNAGSPIVFDRTEQEAGVYMYAVRVRDNGNRYSFAYVQKRANMFKIDLPYYTGFENSDNNSALTIENGEGWALVDSNMSSGNKCYYIYYNSKSQLTFNRIPVKKGVDYNISIEARGMSNQTTTERLSAYYRLNDGSYSYSAINVNGNKYYLYTLSLKSIKENGFLDFYLTGPSGKKGIFVDNFRVEQVSSEDVPDTVKIISNKVAEQGEMSVELKLQNPNKNVCGGVLKNIKGVIISKSTSSRFSPCSYDTIFNPTVGSVSMHKSVVDKAGKWYFKAIAYNDDGTSPYESNVVTTAWVGLDTVPDYPRNAYATSLEDGKILVKWDVVPNNGQGGGFFNGAVTGYEIKRFRGERHEKLNETNGPEDVVTVETNSYTTSSLSSGAYQFEISAIRNNLNKGTANIAGAFAVTKKEHLVLNTNRSMDTRTLPFNIIDTATRSSIAQIIYTKEQMGGVRVIDSLKWFLYSEKQDLCDIKVYIDYREDSVFKNKDEWQSFRTKSTKLVYDGKIELVAGSQTISIPVNSYFYNGSNNLIMTVIKKMSSHKGRVLFYGSDVARNSAVCKYEKLTDKNSTDFDTLSDVDEVKPYKVILSTLPGLVLVDPGNLGVVEGTVKSKRDKTPIEAKVYISTADTTNGKVNINHSFTNEVSDEGRFSFARFVPNTYNIRVSSLGYVDSVFTVTIKGNDTHSYSIELEDANKISVSGTIEDESGKVLASIPIEIKGIEEYKTITNERGEFVFASVYGNTTYDLIAKYQPYQDLEYEFSVEKEDKNLGKIIMSLPITPVSFVVAERKNVGSHIKWEKPYVAGSNEQWISWCNDSSFNSFSAKGLKIIAAARYTPKDMIEKGIVGKKLKTIRVRLTDFSADYTVRVFQGENAEKEIYSKHLGDKYATAWYNIDLPQLLAIDYNKDLYIGIEAADGYKEYAIAIDEGPNKDSLKSMVYFKDRWMDIKTLNSSFNYHLSVLGLFSAPVEIEPANGYDIYRTDITNLHDQSKWTKINDDKVSDNQYTDIAWSSLAMGYYSYAIVASYREDRNSSPVLSNTLSKDLEFNVKLSFKEQDGLDSVHVYMRAKDNNLDHVYDKYVYGSQFVYIPEVWRGEYDIYVSSPYFFGQHKECNIISDTVLEFGLFTEPISDPTIVSCNKIGNNKAKLIWSKRSENSFFDSFEDRKDFEIDSLPPFVLSEPVKKGGVQGVSWPNAGSPQSFMVFNPSKTNPSLDQNEIWKAKEGSKKYIAAIYASGAANNDWIIRPVSGAGILSFFANGAGYLGQKEKMQVLYSKIDANQESFLPLCKDISVASGWNSFEYSIPKDAKFIAIRYISKDIMALFLDDIQYTAETDGLPESYELYMDGTKVSSVEGDINEYMFKNLTYGKHKLGVRAIFRNGESKIVEAIVSIASNELKNANEHIRLYPNPSTDGVYTIDVDKEMRLSIYGSTGEFIMSKVLYKGSNNIDIGICANGTYFFWLDNIYSIKVVKSGK